MSHSDPKIAPETQEPIAIHVVLWLAAFALALRLLPPTLPNFTALGALCLFGGARLRLWLACVVLLGVMAVGDFALWMMHDWMPFNPYVYGSLFLFVLLGRLLRRTESIWKISGAGVVGCVAFFLITNFAVWLASSVPASEVPAGQGYYETSQGSQYDYPLIKYALSFEGLTACYVLALPFFRNMLFATLLFSSAAFGIQAYLWRTVGRRTTISESGSGSA